MKFRQSFLLASGLMLGLIAGGAVAADAPQVPAKKPAVRHFAHPKVEDCHPGMMGGYGMEGGMMGGYGAGMGYGRGMMGGYDMGHGMGIKMLGPRTAIVQSLNLSDEQRGKITKLIDKLQHDNWNTMGMIMDDSGVLRDLYRVDRRDPVAIDATYQKIFDLKRKMIKSALDTENEIEDLLTADQLKQLRDRLHQSAPPYMGQ
ncbi:MAG: Spy/CpxP family protein refolding chaperone [Burkholderiales bacterium]